MSLKTHLFNRLAGPLGPHNASLAFALLCVLVWWAIMDLLHRRNIHFKV